MTYDMVDETYNVQKCTQVSDRVCDTVYDLAKTSKDDFQCVDLKNNDCWDEEKMIQDLVCKYSYSIDCGKHKPQDGKGSVGCTKIPHQAVLQHSTQGEDADVQGAGEQVL